MEVDTIVIGSGAGGLTAAVVAACQGLDVLLVESTPAFGGTTALSGGGVWVPANRHMRGQGIDDSLDEARAYLRSVVGDKYDEARMEAFLRHGAEMVDFLEDNTEVRFLGSDMPDYQPGHPGWKCGRILLSAQYDSRRLGKLGRRLRLPRRELMLFHSFQISRKEMGPLRNAHRSPRALAYTIRVFGEYFWNRLRHGRGVRVVNGNALIARLLASAAARGVTLWPETPARRLIVEGGAVVGAVVERDGAEIAVRARRGVVLATGGLGVSSPERRELIPHAEFGWGLQAEGIRGDGIRLGVAAGGTLNRGNVANGIWQVMSGLPDGKGGMEISIHAFADRHCPGYLMADESGNRFVNEGASYHHIGQVMHARGMCKAWIIAEAGAARRNGLGLAKQWPFPIGPYIRRGYIVQADTIGQLAGKIGVPPLALDATVARFNSHAREGRDPEFQRGQDPYSRYHGDSGHWPNPSLGPLEHGPFYAVRVQPGELSITAGLDTNAQAQVVAADGTPIPGLYAAGLDNNNLFRGHYPGGGCSLGPAMTFAYVAARHMAGLGAGASAGQAVRSHSEPSHPIPEETP